MLLHGGRAISGTGHISFLAAGWSGEKGVPAELHLGDEARFWRYPVRRRLLLGSSLNLPLNRSKATDLASRIETEMDYPGKIKVTVIRELRAVDVAH